MKKLHLNIYINENHNEISFTSNIINNNDENHNDENHNDNNMCNNSWSIILW